MKAWLLAAAPVMAVVTLAGQQATIYQQYAPVDLTGTWVSVVTEDWQFRMITPAKGDFNNIPLNAEAAKVANAWDPAKDEAAGLACEGYAAPTIMREPGRARVSWVTGGNALRVEMDSGEQTRTLNFAGATAPGARSWQGFSQASWEYVGGFNPLTIGAQPAGRAGRGGGAAGGGVRGGGRGGGRGGPAGGALKVVTTNLRAGYLRKNGVPFSQDATVTEYFNVHMDEDGTSWLVVTTIVHDPKYLLVDYITSSNFKKEPDDSKWSPRPCTAR